MGIQHVPGAEGDGQEQPPARVDRSEGSLGSHVPVPSAGFPKTDRAL